MPKLKRPDYANPLHSAHVARVQVIAILQRNAGMSGTGHQALAAAIAKRLASLPWPGEGR